MLYRIITEDKNPTLLEALLQSHVAGYSILHADGFFKGNNQWYTEHSVVIELGDCSKQVVHAIAKEIKARNNQEAVLIQAIPTFSELV
jgi:hypothetical protein